MCCGLKCKISLNAFHHMWIEINKYASKQDLSDLNTLEPTYSSSRSRCISSGLELLHSKDESVQDVLCVGGLVLCEKLCCK